MSEFDPIGVGKNFQSDLKLKKGLDYPLGGKPTWDWEFSPECFRFLIVTPSLMELYGYGFILPHQIL